MLSVSAAWLTWAVFVAQQMRLPVNVTQLLIDGVVIYGIIAIGLLVVRATAGDCCDAQMQ